MSELNRLVVIFLLVLCSACASIGPATVSQDQFDYNAAIAGASHEQLLMNLVRLRYAESPSFLRVSSVISTYTRGQAVNANAGLNSATSGDNSAAIGGSMVWSDRPTITYVPVTGREFSKNLLTPLPPGALLELILAGWPSDLVVRTAMISLNGVGNDVARFPERKVADSEFAEIFVVWRRLGQADAIGLQRDTDAEGNATFTLYFESQNNPAVDADISRYKEMLGLDPDRNEFRIVYGLSARHSDEIAILTGSVWDIMLNLAWKFDVPAEHVEQGRTGPTFVSTEFDGGAPISVKHSAEPPQDAFVSVYAHGYWFYLDQKDSSSKRAFSFLELLLNLAETSTPAASPVITISN